MELDGGWDAHAGHDVAAESQDDASATEISVVVDGVSHDYPATTDLDGDGVADTVHVDATPPAVADLPGAASYDYTDTTGDGVADTLTEYDSHGEVVGRSTFDAAAGAWREVAPGGAAAGGETAGGTAPGDLHEMRVEPGATPSSTGVDTAPDATGTGSRSIVVDGPGGPADAGVASYDTTGDGVLDTAVATTDAGSTVVVTDVDGDGRADYVTEVGHDGTYTSFEHSGGAEWTVVDSGTLGVEDPGTAPPPGSNRLAPDTPPG